MEDKVEIVDLHEGNIKSEDVVCVRGPANKEGIECKKDWLRARFKEGLVFKKLIVNGRSWGFIEYLPAESAWRPVNAPGYMFIDCIWVIGRHKGKGYGKLLLDKCIEDSRNMNGICAVTGNRPFMARKDLFLGSGFELYDTAPLYYELLVRNHKEAPMPEFYSQVKSTTLEDRDGIVFVYSDQCPYIVKFMNVMIEVAEDMQFPVRKVKLESAEQARRMPFAYGTYGVFYNGRFLTHEILTREGFAKLLNSATKG
jgi:GNAT superfamily N-acetyltransferase